MAETVNYQDAAYAAILKQIMRLELVPGQRINKKALETQLGIGTTPVREAIIRLQREGLIVVQPQSGTYVAKIALAEVYQARFVRESLEKVVVVESIPKMTADDFATLNDMIAQQKKYLAKHEYDHFFDLDDAFHKTFYQVDAKDYVWNWIQLCNLQFNRFRYLRLEVKDLDWQQIIDDHQAILDAVKNKQGTRAETAVSRHLHMVDADAAVAVKAHSNYFA